MKMVMIGFALSTIGLCSGCMFHPPIVPFDVTQPTPHCETASVVLTNLTLPPAQRHYLLPNEQPCMFSNIPNEDA